MRPIDGKTLRTPCLPPKGQQQTGSNYVSKYFDLIPDRTNENRLKRQLKYQCNNICKHYALWYIFAYVLVMNTRLNDEMFICKQKLRARYIVLSYE